MLFNSNFRYLRAESKLSMAELAHELTQLTDEKEVKISAISSYEDSTSPKYEVLLAIKNYFKTYDPNLSLDDLMERNLEMEGYRLPIETVNKKLDELTKTDPKRIVELQDEIKELKNQVSSLIRIIEKMQS